MRFRVLPIAIIIGVFGLGALGGVWAQAFLMPYVASRPSFQKWDFVRDWGTRGLVIRETREVVISMDDAIERVAEGAQSLVVGVESKGSDGVIRGSGFVVASDGFILTLASVVPQGYETRVYMNEGGESFLAEVLKRDFRQNLAILKINEQGMHTAGFASQVRVGAPLVMVAKTLEEGSLITVVNQGSVRTQNQDMVRTNIFDKTTLGGSPLLDLEGRIVGLSTFEPNGRLIAIPSSVLRAFSGL